jgi:predicted 2-oxoglutarate/Fe(II)-dependent dioxygenase YbiX
MSIEEKRELFKQKGYCDFSVKDVDVDFYNFLEQNLICDSEKNIQHRFYEFRFDSDKIETTFVSSDETYQTAKAKKEEFLKESDENKISQCWYYNSKIEDSIKIQIRKGIDNIIKYFYDYDTVIRKNPDELQFTYYDEGCVFTNHNDGATRNMCSIIIYLNKNYDKSNGGLLFLGDGYVVPEFGQCALMDLSTHDIIHGVTRVTGGPGRYAILSFLKRF